MPRNIGIATQMMKPLLQPGLKTIFLFARIASLLFWFRQNVFFTLLAAILDRFSLQFSTADIPPQCPQKPLKVVEILKPCLMQAIFS